MTGPNECFYIGDAQYPEDILANHLRRKKKEMIKRPDAAPPKEVSELKLTDHADDYKKSPGSREFVTGTLEVEPPKECPKCGVVFMEVLCDHCLRVYASPPETTEEMVEALGIIDFYLIDANHSGPFEEPQPEGTVEVLVHELRKFKLALQQAALQKTER